MCEKEVILLTIPNGEESHHSEVKKLSITKRITFNK